MNSTPATKKLGSKKRLKLTLSLRLIVIDTWKMYRNAKDKRVPDYDEDYDGIARVQNLSRKYNVAIVIIHHTKKGKCDEAIEEVSGTTGLRGAADGDMVLGEKGRTVLVGEGRDVERFNLAVDFDKETCRWHFIREITENEETQSRATQQEKARNLLCKVLAHGPKPIPTASNAGRRSGLLMLDKPEKTDQYLIAVRAGMPFEVELTPSLVAHLQCNTFSATRRGNVG